MMELVINDDDLVLRTTTVSSFRLEQHLSSETTSPSRRVVFYAGSRGAQPPSNEGSPWSRMRRMSLRLSKHRPLTEFSIPSTQIKSINSFGSQQTMSRCNNFNYSHQCMRKGVGGFGVRPSSIIPSAPRMNEPRFPSSFVTNTIESNSATKLPSAPGMNLCSRQSLPAVLSERESVENKMKYNETMIVKQMNDDFQCTVHEVTSVSFHPG